MHEVDVVLLLLAVDDEHGLVGVGDVALDRSVLAYYCNEVSVEGALGEGEDEDVEQIALDGVNGVVEEEVVTPGELEEVGAEEGVALQPHDHLLLQLQPPGFPLEERAGPVHALDVELVVDPREDVLVLVGNVLREAEGDHVGEGEVGLVGEGRLGGPGRPPALLVQPPGHRLAPVLFGEGDLVVGDVADLGRSLST